MERRSFHAEQILLKQLKNCAAIDKEYAWDQFSANRPQIFYS